MEIALPPRNSRTIMMVATLAVFVLGLALSFSTWRNLRQQQETFREHAVVTARAIAAGIEINLRRELRLPSSTEHANALLRLRRALAKDLLKDYIKRSDARFIGLYNPLGHILFSLLTTTPGPSTASFRPSPGRAWAMPVNGAGK